VFDAAFERKIFAIGVDSNQNWVRPGTILTSMVKRVDVAVYETCKSIVEGKFAGGVVRFDLANQGIDIAIDEHNEKLFSPEQRKKLDGLKQDIIKGTIKVPDYYVTGGSK
jgi:basic membrane protein A